MTIVRDRHRDRMGGRRSFSGHFMVLVLFTEEFWQEGSTPISIGSARFSKDFHTEACIGKGMEGNVSIFLGYAMRS